MSCAPGTPVKFLSPKGLHEILTENSCNVITIDVRPFSDFVVGHIAGAFSVRLSSLLIRRLAQGKIPFIDIVADDQKVRFRSWSADNKKRVVVYDENASEVELGSVDAKNPILVVTKSLLQTFADVCILQGGYSTYKALAPDTVETADDERPNPLFSHCPCEVANERSPVDKHVRDTTPSEILPFLYVGSQQHAQSRPILEQLKISHILNITATCPNWYADTIQYKNIQIKDTWNQNITSYFEDAFQFIDSARNAGGRVLVHCVAGISRSPTITIAYLMRTHNLSLQAALAHVKTQRNIVSPNLDFLVELEQYERFLNPSLGPAPLISPDPPDTAAPFACNITGASEMSAMDTGSDCLPASSVPVVAAAAAAPAAAAAATDSAGHSDCGTYKLPPTAPLFPRSFPSTPAFPASSNALFQHSVSSPALTTAAAVTPTFGLGLGHAFSSFALTSPHLLRSEDAGAHPLGTPTGWVGPDTTNAPWNLSDGAAAATTTGWTGSGPVLAGLLRNSFSPRGSPYLPRRDPSPRQPRRDPACCVSPISPAQGIFAL